MTNSWILDTNKGGQFLSATSNREFPPKFLNIYTEKCEYLNEITPKKPEIGSFGESFALAGIWPQDRKTEYKTEIETEEDRKPYSVNLFCKFKDINFT